MSASKSETNPVRIALVAYPDAQQSAILGIGDLFATAASLSGRAVTITQVTAEAAAVAAQDAVILPPTAVGCRPIGALDWLTNFLERQHAQGAVICSVCAGLHWLAATRIVAGRSVTTHWALEADMAMIYPALNLETDRLLIDAPDMVTAGGMMSWMDLTLVLIERFWSSDVADEVARIFVVDRGRSNQARYRRFQPKRDHGDRSILKVQRQIDAKHARALRVDRIAAEAGMSLRTFLRRFRRATGLTPSRYLQEARVEAARRLLVETQNSIAHIGHAVGYTDPAAFGRVFAKIAGETPGAFREAARRL